MGKTSIEWCDRSINPFRARHKMTDRVGHYCEKISPGCTNCYASALQRRFGTPEFGGGHLRDQFELFLDETQLTEVLRHRKPERWFWNDMTDGFGDWVPDDWLDKCFAVMAVTVDMTHQVLTKRPELMLDYLADSWTAKRIAKQIDWLVPRLERIRKDWSLVSPIRDELLRGERWPLPNVWCGVSVENQEQADARIQYLLGTPATVRFLSAEPLLEPIDLSTKSNLGIMPSRALGSSDLVIIGGESGAGARPCDIAWIRSLIHQCKGASVPCFIKQLGTHSVRHGWNSASGTVSRLRLKDRNGGDINEWPEDLRVRAMP